MFCGKIAIRGSAYLYRKCMLVILLLALHWYMIVCHLILHTIGKRILETFPSLVVVFFWAKCLSFFRNMASLSLPSLEVGAVRGMEPPAILALPCTFCEQATNLSAYELWIICHLIWHTVAKCIRNVSIPCGIPTSKMSFELWIFLTKKSNMASLLLPYLETGVVRGSKPVGSALPCVFCP
jgi:hypothetical protein